MARFVVQHADEAVTGHLPGAEAPRIDAHLRVPADPTSLSVVRHALGGLATALGLTPSHVADLRLAITEAVSTAIRRCEGCAEQVEVHAEHDGEAFRVIVSDHGRALPINGDLPLPLVAAVTDAVEVTHLPGGGTAVTLTFRTAERLPA